MLPPTYEYSDANRPRITGGVMLRRRLNYLHVYENSIAGSLFNPAGSRKNTRTVRFLKFARRDKAKMAAGRLLFRFMPQAQLREYIQSTWGFVKTNPRSRRYDPTTSQNQVALWASSLSVGIRTTIQPTVHHVTPTRQIRRRTAKGPRGRKFLGHTRPLRLPVRLRRGLWHVRKLLRIRAVFNRTSVSRRVQRFCRYFMPNVHTQPIFTYKPAKPRTTSQHREYLRNRYAVGGRGLKGLSLVKNSSNLLLKKSVLTMRR